MDYRQRIVSAIETRAKAQGPSAWVPQETLQKITGMSSEALSMALADMEADHLLEASGSSGYLKNRFRLNALCSKIIGNAAERLSSNLTSSSDEPAPGADAADQACAARSFSAMAGLMLANEKERLSKVAQVMSSTDLRKLPCLAVTNDLQKPLYKLRRRQAHAKVLKETGMDIKPLGKVDILTLNSSGASKNSFSGASLMTERMARSGGVVLDSAITTPSTEHGGQFLRATVAERDADGQILSVNLPKGGVAAPSEIRQVEAVGSVLVLQLGRRVNAKMIMLTAEGAESLVNALDFSGMTNPQDRPSSGELQSVTVRNDRHELILDRSLLARRASKGKDNGQDKFTVNGAKGGKTTVSNIESVQYAGPVLMLNLDRRVNARSITISHEAGLALRQNLSAVMGAMA